MINNSNNTINELKSIRREYMGLLALLAQLVEVCKQEGLDSSTFVPLIVQCTADLQHAQQLTETLIAHQREAQEVFRVGAN